MTIGRPPKRLPDEAFVTRVGDTMDVGVVANSFARHFKVANDRPEGTLIKGYHISANSIPEKSVEEITLIAGLHWKPTVRFTTVGKIREAGFEITPTLLLQSPWTKTGHCDIHLAESPDQMPDTESIMRLCEAFYGRAPNAAWR